MRREPEPPSGDGAHQADQADQADGRVPHDADEPPEQQPRPLVVAAAVTGLEALGFLAFAVWLIPAFRTERPEVDLTAIAFFVLWGAGLGYCARQLLHGQSWARAPVVLAQLIQIPVGWSFWQPPTTVVAIVLWLSAAAVLVGLFHPRSIEALEHG